MQQKSLVGYIKLLFCVFFFFVGSGNLRKLMVRMGKEKPKDMKGVDLKFFTKEKVAETGRIIRSKIHLKLVMRSQRRLARNTDNF